MTSQRSYIRGFHMMSSLGVTIEQHKNALVNNHSGITKRDFDFGSFYVSAVADRELELIRKAHKIPVGYSRLEAMACVSIEQAIISSNLEDAIQQTPLFLASTKGNVDGISHITHDADSQVHLVSTSQRIQKHFEMMGSPTVVCNACTSGLMALIMASRMIQAGIIKQAIVCGVDVLSEFTLRGFTALHAMDTKPCQPFDESRMGITLGEGCGTIVLSSESGPGTIELLGGGTSNDANHISGPSRTGEGLQRAIRAALNLSNHPNLDFINAHGTATRYNDEMEAQAFHALGLHQLPIHSMKGYWGHTLGAAGMLETIATILSLQEGILYRSLGYQNHGVTLPLNIIDSNHQGSFQCGLKTSSGFGGSNAALVLRKT